MLKLEDINAAIEVREQQDRLSDEVCSELCWLYTIRNEMEKRNKPKSINAPMLYSQANGTINRTERSAEVSPLTISEAKEWAYEMGEHWNYEQAKEAMARKQISGSPIDFFATLDLMYSTFSDVAEKYQVSSLDFFADLAQAFLKDGGREKIASYYEYVAK